MMPMMPPPWPAPQRSGGKSVFIAILAVLLIFSVVINFALLVFAALSAGPQPGHTVQKVLKSGDASQGIAVIVESL